MSPKDPISVSEYLEAINSEVSKLQADVLGEVIKVMLAASGHVYFDIKDLKENAQVNCVMWAGAYQALGIEIKEGAQIVCTGVADIYLPT